ncbi:hypothetical protein EES43_29185 [Streptomyces sp. ADI96-02]|uniref:hypothetical protein n=1 Tax=Streptomyces sp. ADI96-02 TaxID=1522760 RepID=UPI000F5530FB|nr:hypothetical protein [Streptomyces sp. ADI96-02]RPK54238.1 hypothetical protein EES43_29185 [Streptomyces sp. ADI96-02]
MTVERLRFDGWIAGVGTASGTRLVVGHWPRSPFGAFSDVMIQHPDGERILLAPTRRIAEFVSATYRFERIDVLPVSVTADGPEWRVHAGPLRLWLRTGRRSALGLLLTAVPAPLARSPYWAALCDVPARLMPGVRTRGSAGSGRREWYGARDHRPVREAGVVLDGTDLGGLAPLSPPVEFGFGSAPRGPSLVRVTTTVELAATAR